MKKLLIFGIAVLGVAVGVFMAVDRRRTKESNSNVVDARHLSANGKTIGSKTATEAVREAMRGVPNKRTSGKRKPPPDLFANLAGKDRKLAEAVQAALDNNDLDATLAATAKALSSTNAEVRLSAVEALAWFGANALPELTGAMSDPDDEVASAAESAWDSAMSEIEDANRRFSIAAAVMASFSQKDSLETISTQLESAAQELIDNEDDEEKASELRFSVIQSLVNIMDSGSDNSSAQAKEAYESITGYEWRSLDEAERYLRDPDAYELPDDDMDSTD